MWIAVEGFTAGGAHTRAQSNQSNENPACTLCNLITMEDNKCAVSSSSSSWRGGHSWHYLPQSSHQKWVLSNTISVIRLIKMASDICFEEDWALFSLLKILMHRTVIKTPKRLQRKWPCSRSARVVLSYLNGKPGFRASAALSCAVRETLTLWALLGAYLRFGKCTGCDAPAFLCVCSLCYQPKKFSSLGGYIPSSLKSTAVLWILSYSLTCVPPKKAARHIAFITEQRQNGREQTWVSNLRVMMWLRDYNILWTDGRLGSYVNHLALLLVFGKSLDRCSFAINLFPGNPNCKDTWFSAAWKTQN